MKVIGDVPGSEMSYVRQRHCAGYRADVRPVPHQVFRGDADCRRNGRGMAATRTQRTAYYVIEGAEKVYGMAGAEKSVATIIFDFAGKNSASDKRLTD